jgi:geranylgeranyl diphosphate synthase type II
MELESPPKIEVEWIDRTLEELIGKRTSEPHSKLFEAARYSLLSPGKRLRPLLTLATVKTFGTPIEKALIPACALEMVHTYSLIHDDLPCMDDDDMRRGKPTLHKVFPEGHAVLTGDYLLTYAFQLLSESPDLLAEQKLELVRILSQSAGGDGMVGGQIVDLEWEGKHIDWPLLQFMHIHKTAALITASLLFGAVIAQVDETDYLHLQSFGRNLGLAFQIVDDILDSHEETHKATSVTLLGPDKAQRYAEELYASALTSLSSLSKPAPDLRLLASKLIHRSS